MTTQFALSPIQAKTKGEVRRLRQAGFVPISIQHKGMATRHYQQNMQLLDAFIQEHGDAALLDLVIAPDNRPERVILHDVQRDAITGKLLQVTFQQIGRDDILKTHVALVFQGEPAGVHNKEAMMQHQVDRLDIECAQDNLPDSIVVDITHLLPGDVLRVSDLPENPRYKIVTSSDTVLTSLTLTRTGADREEVAEAPSAIV